MVGCVLTVKYSLNYFLSCRELSTRILVYHCMVPNRAENPPKYPGNIIHSAAYKCVVVCWLSALPHFVLERTQTEAQFLDVIGTKVLKDFLLVIHSHLY
jgi:hypothetical protein